MRRDWVILKGRCDNLKKLRYLLNRRVIQVLSAIGSNSYFKGFIDGKIYTGNSKKVCVPFMNCYSCPGARMGCPIGSLQAFLYSAKHKVSYYVIGFLTLIGVTMGRFVCGYLCPFGLIQELLYKIPSPKLKIPERLKYFKYVFLILFVVLLTVIWRGPAFCKYMCPVGTLEAGIPLSIANSSIRAATGNLFLLKVLLTVIIMLLSIITFRPFCKVICPLGAILAFFNTISIYRYEVDKSKCTSCGLCHRKCKMNVKVYENPNSLECIRCGECKEVCPTNAIKSVIKIKE